MQSLRWYARRLGSMGPAEIVWRVRSMLRDQVDIVRVPLGITPKLGALTSGSLRDFEPGFACSPVTIDHWRQQPPDVRQRRAQRVARKADDILNNRLSYFDLDSVHHGEPFNWHRDHSAGIDSPVRLSVLTDYRDFNTYGDCKLVWEPNRHHQFVVLARAYVATGELKYAEKIAALMRSWIDANPFGYGMNWKSVLEHGVRVINWVWALDLIRGSGVIDDTLWRDIQQCVYLSLWDGHRKFSRGSSANNHLIGEAAGVFTGACYFRDFPNADTQARAAQAVLETEILRQTYDDGCTREHAFGYQFFVIQFFTLCLRAGEASGRSFSDEFRARLHSMYRFLKELSADSGAPPNMGDRDDGYVLDLGELPNQAAALLDAGAELFDDATLRSPAVSETAYWLAGVIHRSEEPTNGRVKSVSFPESGYHLLRSPRLGVFFDCAELGYGPIAAHGNADCLSICLCADGQPVLVDAGTYDYFTSPEWRNYFRETRAHNTVELDRHSQSTMLGPFIWGQRARPNLLEWSDDSIATIATGQHDGYTKLDDPVVHRRKLTLDKNSHSLTITDSFDAKSTHIARVHFHLEPGLAVHVLSDTQIEIKLRTGTLTISTSNDRIQCIQATNDTKLGWISGSYHTKVASTCLRIEREVTGGSEIQTAIRLS